MALIKCSECGKEISNEAIGCPFCGKPIREEVITTQSTSKIWKAIKFLSWLGIFFAIIMYGNNSKDLANIVLLFCIIGLIVGKLGAWWTNK